MSFRRRPAVRRRSLSRQNSTRISLLLVARRNMAGFLVARRNKAGFLVARRNKAGFRVARHNKAGFLVARRNKARFLVARRHKARFLVARPGFLLLVAVRPGRQGRQPGCSQWRYHGGTCTGIVLQQVLLWREGGLAQTLNARVGRGAGTLGALGAKKRPWALGALQNFGGAKFAKPPALSALLQESKQQEVPRTTHVKGYSHATKVMNCSQNQNQEYM